MPSNLLNPRISDFINANFEKDTDKEQAEDMIFADRQYENILQCIENVRTKLNQIKYTICDYGCGESCNLLRYLSFTYASQLEHIAYYAINKKEFVFDDRIYDSLNLLGNKLKNLDDIFFPLEKASALITSKSFITADIVILKNVLHEVEILDIPELLKNIFSIMGKGKYLILYDFADFKKHESNRFPYTLSDLREIFLNIMKFELINEYDQSVPLEYQEINDKSQLALLIVKKNTKNLENASIIKHKLYKFYLSKLKTYREEIENYVELVRSGQNLTEIQKIRQVKITYYNSALSIQFQNVLDWENKQ